MHPRRGKCHTNGMDVHYLGQVDYAASLAAMRRFVAQPAQERGEELWLCEHPPVYTLGRAGHAEHLLAASDIPLVQSDRGGEITYHGLGQVVAYPLISLARRPYFVKEYVYRLEEAALRTLGHYGLVGHRVAGAPGVYLRLQAPFEHGLLPQRPRRREPGSPRPVPDFTGVGKIAALGVKVSNHCCYHGMALNVAMDLGPFSRIAPCGYTGLPTVDMATFGVTASRDEVARVLARHLQQLLAA